MSRLTIQEVIEHCERTVKGYEWTRTEQERENIKQYWEHKQTAEWLKELQHYKDLEEQGRLVVLPCKVGDTVWAFMGYAKDIKECEIVSIIIESNNDVRVSITTGNDFIKPLATRTLGKTAFLTKEEAQKRLEELKNG